MARSDLPFGSEFSPAQIDLANLLELAHEHGPDWKAFENAVRERYFSAHRTSDYNIDGADLSRIEARPAQVVDVFNRESRHAMALKRLERQEIER